MSLGAGSTESIVSNISSYGANVLTVSPGKFRRGPGGGGGTFDTLTAEDAEEIEETGVHISTIIKFNLLWLRTSREEN